MRQFWKLAIALATIAGTPALCYCIGRWIVTPLFWHPVPKIEGWGDHAVVALLGALGAFFLFVVVMVVVLIADANWVSSLTEWIIKPRNKPRPVPLDELTRQAKQESPERARRFVS